MLLSPQHQHHHHHLHPTIHGYCYIHIHSTLPLNPKTLLPFPPNPNQSKPFISSSLRHTHHQTSQAINEEEDIRPNTQELLRKHNSNSTTLLRRLLSQQGKGLEVVVDNDEQEKVRLLELSLGKTDMENDKILKQAIAIRRQVTSEILKISMTSADFPSSYSKKLVSLMPQFIDHVLVEAAAMKHLPEFSQASFSTRAKTCIQNLRVVPFIRWLEYNSLTYHQIAKLVCMSCGNLKLVESRVQWLKTLDLKGSSLGFVLMKAGASLLEKSADELDEIIRYLENNGVSRDCFGLVVCWCPHVLTFTVEEVRSHVAFYLNMGIDEEDFGKMMFNYPKSFGSLTLEEMTCKVDYLKEFGLSNEDVGRLIAIKPPLMACSIEEDWKPLVKYLSSLGVCRDGMRRILTLKPMIFCVDLEKRIAPKVQFLQDMGIKEEAIGKMIVKFPTLLTYSFNKQIRPVVNFLMTNAGVAQKDIEKVLAFCPELLGYDIHKLDVNVDFFLSLGISLPLLGEMIADFPMLLRYTFEVLQSKYQYLRGTMARPLQELIEFPRFFSYSLEGRIIPRHKVVLEKGLNFDLCQMIACSDEKFNQRVEAALEKRRKFESGNLDVPLSNIWQSTDNLMEKFPVDIEE